MKEAVIIFMCFLCITSGYIAGLATSSNQQRMNELNDSAYQPNTLGNDWIGNIAWGYKSEGFLTEGKYCIALGYKAGYDWTTQKRMFAFSLPNSDGTYTEYSTQMTKDEYLNVFHVVIRALKYKRILEP